MGKIESVKSTLHTLESGQFAFQRHSVSEKEALLHQVKTLAKWFDKKIRK